jgi:hypothetical protein
MLFFSNDLISVGLVAGPKIVDLTVLVDVAEARVVNSCSFGSHEYYAFGYFAIFSYADEVDNAKIVTNMKGRI